MILGLHFHLFPGHFLESAFIFFTQGWDNVHSQEKAYASCLIKWRNSCKKTLDTPGSLPRLPGIQEPHIFQPLPPPQANT